MAQFIRFIFLLSFVMVSSTSSHAQTLQQQYSYVQVSDIAVELSVQKDYYDLINNLVKPSVVTVKQTGIERIRTNVNKTSDLYLLLFAVVLFGAIKFTAPRYFYHLFKALRNPMYNNQQLSDQMDSGTITNWVMNVFFAVIGGLYVYYLIVSFSPQRSVSLLPSTLIPILMASVGLVYIVKYLTMKFSGWVFNVQGIIDNYLFNVFLVNKVMAIVLLPIIVLIALVQPEMTNPVIILSFIVLGLLLVNRYVRSWHIFGAFFRYSKFHFFMYLCASEILPMAVLTKFLVRILY